MHPVFSSPTHLLLLLGPVTVRTPRDLDALARHTYILAAVVALSCLAIAAAIAHVIKFEGGARPRDPAKRRLWFWAVLVAGVAAFFLYNMYGVAPRVAINLQPRFLTANATSAAVVAATYLIVGFLMSRMFATGKLGNWFGSSR